MLIENGRHTEADIELWAEYEEADLIYYKSTDMAKKESLAIDIIKQFCDEKYYLSVSWGKDSTVMLHLAVRANKINCAASFVRDPSSILAVYDFNNDYVRTAFLSAYKLPLYVEVIYPETGMPEKLKTMRRFEKRTGIDKCILGVRAGESGQRKMSARIHGKIAERKCRPLLGWSTQDIFSYLAYYKLPVHPVYGMLGGGRYQRDRIRVDGAIGGTGGLSHGRDIWEREYYQDILNKINVQFADVSYEEK